MNQTELDELDYIMGEGAEHPTPAELAEYDESQEFSEFQDCVRQLHRDR